MTIKIGDQFKSGHTKDEVLTVAKKYGAKQFSLKVGRSTQRIMGMVGERHGPHLQLSHIGNQLTELIKIEKET